MRAPLLVGVVDSGVAAELPRLVAARAFSRGETGELIAGEANADPSGHGTQICRLLVEVAGAGGLRPGLLVAQAFSAAGSSPAQLAAAISWLVDAGAAVINLSVGLRTAASELRLACERAASAGVVLVASAPARGAPVYPAAYAQCIAVCGDARCGADEISSLDGGNADFGAHPGAHPGAVAGDPASRGASFAAARLSARVALLLAAGTTPQEVPATLRAQARYHGAERRQA